MDKVATIFFDKTFVQDILTSMKTGILLINLGTPDAPTRPAVKKYLTEFLTDPRVIDIPWIRRQILVRGVIIPSRLSQSLKSYQTIWNKEGSPLYIYTKKSAELLQEKLGKDYQVEIGMRYQSPSIKEALKKLLANPLKELVILPLFPQYASATTGSIFEKVFQELGAYHTLPKLTFIDQFHDHPGFIKAFKEVSAPFIFKDYDHILFSFHGLPERQLQKSSCYAVQCHQTAIEIAKTCELAPSHYTLCFQSRLGKEPWIQPFTSDTIKDLAKRGAKKILVFCPSFVSDCLETLFEISIEYQELFREEGGETLDLVPGLNFHPAWIDALESVVRNGLNTSSKQILDPSFDCEPVQLN